MDRTLTAITVMVDDLGHRMHRERNAKKCEWLRLQAPTPIASPCFSRTKLNCIRPILLVLENIKLFSNCRTTQNIILSNMCGDGGGKLT